MKKKLTKAVKYDGEKIRVELWSSLAFMETAKVLTSGAHKYEDDNWRYGFRWRRLIGGAIRHIFAFMRGEDNDPETGLSHIAHAMCCLMFLLEHILTGNGIDDRWDELNKMSRLKGRVQNNRGKKFRKDFTNKNKRAKLIKQTKKKGQINVRIRKEKRKSWDENTSVFRKAPNPTNAQGVAQR